MQFAVAASLEKQRCNVWHLHSFVSLRLWCDRFLAFVVQHNSKCGTWYASSAPGA